MKIVFIYRKPFKEAYSIEILFNTIAQEMGKHVEVIEYVTGGYFRILQDVYRLRKLKADIYHITGDINYLAIFLPRKKTVLTIHDIIHLLSDLTGFKRWLYKLLWFSFPFFYVRHITAVSQMTKEDLVTALKIKNEITVIPNCYNPIFKPVVKKFNRANPTIFQIGALPHKNLIRLIEALRSIPCHLVIIGKLDDRTIHLLKDCQIQYSNYVGITLSQVYDLYISSDILSFVSLAEGFGMPIIEAQAIGRAVITSNCSPMDIVAGNGACLVNPLKIDEINRGILKIIDDDIYRGTLIKAGLANARQYSVEKITALYLDYYYKNGLLKYSII